MTKDAIDRQKALYGIAKLRSSYDLSIALNKPAAMTDEDKMKIECWEKFSDELQELFDDLRSLPAVQTQEGEDGEEHLRQSMNKGL